jgi:hypothetical protein
MKQRKANWIGHTLRSDCLLRHINGERWKKGRSDEKKRKNESSYSMILRNREETGNWKRKH